MALKKKNRSNSGKRFSVKSLLGNAFLTGIAAVIVLAMIVSIFQKDYISNLITQKIDNFSQKTGFVVEDFTMISSNEYCPVVTTSLLEEFRHQPIFTISLDKIKEKLSEYDCVQDVRISRAMPNLLKIEIINQEPAAILQNRKRFSFITKQNTLMKIRNSENLDNLIIFTGNKSENHALSLLSILAVDDNIFSQVDSVMRVGERRWDVRMKNGTEIKLPEKNIEIAWTKLIKLYNESEELKDNKAKMIDLRVEGKLYIQNK